MTLIRAAGLGFGLGFVSGVGDLVGDPVHPFVRHVLESLEVLLVVLAGDDAFFDAALDRTAVVEARILSVLVTSHGGFS